MKTMYFIFIIILVTINLYSTIINVPADQTTIQAGITAAANGDTVLVQPDTYYENINFNGKLITVASLYYTTLDASYISSTIINGNATGSVVTFYSGEGLAAVLAGFTLTNGSATRGGGIRCEESSPTLHSLIISGNSVSNSGGGISCFESCYPRLENVTIIDNIASNNGGGISCVIACNPSLENVTISGNSAQGYGGGVYCLEDSYPSLENVTISYNFAGISGGGIYCEFSSNPSLLNSIMWNNSPQEIYRAAGGSITVIYSDVEGGWTGTGNIDSDPLFVNPGSGDFHLQAASPCIDAGDPVSPLDPDETRADIGAFYFNQYNGPVYHISTTGSDITGIGAEAYPFATIQHGIDEAVDTDTVLVQPGTYAENINYNGKLITVASLFLTPEDASYVSTTIIDGNADGHVVTFNSFENSNAVLSGFTITNGFAVYGGGIFCQDSSPYLNHVIISGNSASGASYASGGGICCYSSSPSLENVTISGNSASSDYAISCGGGIYCNGSSNLSMQNVTISGNSASGDSAQGYGGGIYSNNSNPNLENVILISNSANGYGGGIYYEDSNPSMQNVTITDNYGGLEGGGVYCADSNSILQNVTVTSNSATLAGGILSYNSNLSLLNSILWNDSSYEIHTVAGGSVTATYSDIQGGWPGTGNIDSDPLFADPGNGYYHLTWTNFPIPDATMSPCINAGDPASPLDPDASTADMGAYYFEISTAAPSITAITDAPDDQGRSVQLIWNRSIYDPVAIGSYSIWRYDDIFDDRGLPEIYNNPVEIFEKAAEDDSKQYYWQRDNEILAFITQLPAMGFSQYSIIAPTLKDSSIVSMNYSIFKVFAHTELTAVYVSSLPDSGYSMDNIAPSKTEVYIAQDGNNLSLSWDEIEDGTFQGNYYPEVNGIWYKIYAGDSTDFICDEAHLIETVTNLNYDYPTGIDEKKFFKIRVSDQP